MPSMLATIKQNQCDGCRLKEIRNFTHQKSKASLASFSFSCKFNYLTNRENERCQNFVGQNSQGKRSPTTEECASSHRKSSKRRNSSKIIIFDSFIGRYGLICKITYEPETVSLTNFLNKIESKTFTFDL